MAEAASVNTASRSGSGLGSGAVPSAANAAGFHHAVDTLSPSEWNTLVSRFSDAAIHQTSVFGALRWGADKLSHIVLYERDEPVAAAQVIVVTVPLLGTGIAHCKFGPLWRRRGAPARLTVYRAMLSAMREEYAGRRGLVLRIKPWETEADDGPLARARIEAGFEMQAQLPRYHTFVLDLSRSLEELRAGFHHKWRYNLKKAEKQALTVTRGHTAADADTYMQLYAEMRDLKTYVDTSEVDLLPALMRELPEGLRPEVFVAHADGRPAAAIVISLIGDTAYYLFGATGEAGRNNGASYVLFWEALQWLKERDCRWFDLVGSQPQGTGGGVGYRRFKSGMTGKNGDEYHMADWDAIASWRSRIVVHGGTRLRELSRAVRHELNGIRERLLGRPSD